MTEFDPTLMSKRARDALAFGLTRKQMRGPSVIRPTYGVVRPSSFTADPATLAVSDAVALMSEQCVLGGWASLWAQGNRWFDGRRGADPVLVHCLPGAQLRVRAGIRPSEATVHPDEIIALRHYDVTTLARAAFDEMKLAPNLRHAVVVLDLATSTTTGAPHTTIAAVERVMKSHHKTRGIVQARKALTLGSSRSASPWETRTRLIATLDAGVSGLLVNAPVFDQHGRLIGVADLFDPDSGLVVESDGDDHREQDRHTTDNRREEKFERAGCVVCRLTSLDHGDRYAAAARIRGAHRDARRATRRLWTLDVPDWWRDWPSARRWL